jgi:hypothetical protein
MTLACYANLDLYKRLVMLSAGRDTVDELTSTLREEMNIEKVIDENAWERRFWVELGIRYRKRKRVHEALQVFHALYQRLLEHQIEVGPARHVNKGDSLYHIGVSHSALGRPVIARRYMMLALCEDAVDDQGKVEPYTVATYGWLVGRLGFSRPEYDRYVSEAWRLWKELGADALFPELILQELGQQWMTEHPAAREVGVYAINRRCVEHLLRAYPNTEQKATCPRSAFGGVVMSICMEGFDGHKEFVKVSPTPRCSLGTHGAFITEVSPQP